MGVASILLREVGMKALRSYCRSSSPLLPVFPSIPLGRKGFSRDSRLSFQSPRKRLPTGLSLADCQHELEDLLSDGGWALAAIDTPQGVQWGEQQCSVTSGSPSGSQLGPGSAEPRIPLLACERCRDCSRPESSQAGDRAKQQLAGQRGQPGWRLARGTGGRQMARRKQMHCPWARQETRAGRDRERDLLYQPESEELHCSRVPLPA